MNLLNEIKELYEYRQMIYGLVRRELRGKYKGSVLGFLWTFINPLLQLLVYTLVFSVIMRSDIATYYIFLFVALVPWIFFSTAIQGGSTSIINSADMVKKIYFPREVLPISCVISAFVNMFFSFIVVFIVLLVTGFGINFTALLYMPIVMVVELIFSMGIAMIVAGLTVYFRDLSYILNIVTMAWQFLTPVMYPAEWVPEQLMPIWKMNPLTPIIDAYRDILYYKVAPELDTLIQATVIGILFIIIGYIAFRKMQRGFAEEL